MSSHKAWVEALHVPTTEYQTWARELPKQESLTFWCLETGRLDEPQYFNWARDHYGLATINHDFFRQSPNHQFWSQIQSVANWSPNMIPIAQWDGVVFVGCVEPAEDIRWSFPVCYVLASPRDLKHYWQQLMTSREKSFSGVPPTPDRQTAASELSEDIVAINDDEANENQSPIHHHSAVVLGDEPAGLDLKKFAQTQAPPASDYMEALAQQIKSNENTSDVTAPENLNWSPKNNGPADSIAMPEGINFNFSQAVPAMPVIAVEKAPAPPMAPPPPMTPPPPPADAPMSDEKTNFVMMPTQSKPSYSTILPRLRADFVGAMILDIENDKVIPNCWDEKFNKSSPLADSPVDLNTASAFRVAVRTKMPYLGQVVDTPINSAFFQAWGFKELPKMVLVQPILDGQKVTHLILCLCDTLKKSHQHLRAGDKAVENFTKSFGNKAA